MNTDVDDNPRSLSIADCRHLNALVIDPNHYIRGIICDALRRNNIGGLSSCSSSDEAYVSCEQFIPNFILCDWDAGGMSGLDFTRSMRRNERNVKRETPVIMLAEQISIEMINTARNAGVDEILLKPISAASLKSRIDEVVLRPRKFIDSRNYIGPCRRRKDAQGFAGPFRRLLDDTPEVTTRKMNPDRFEKLRKIVNQLTKFVSEDNDDTRQVVKGIYTLLITHKDSMDQLNDPIITRIWFSALRYIEGVGITPQFDPEVVLRHFQAISVIIDLPESAISAREELMQDLDKLVTKRLHAFDLKFAS